MRLTSIAAMALLKAGLTVPNIRHLPAGMPKLYATSAYTAWRRGKNNKYTPGHGGSAAVSSHADGLARAALGDHQLKRAARWLRSYGGECVEVGRAREKRVVARVIPPAHIAEKIARNWSVLCA